MAEEIAIPSPSVFLRASPSPPKPQEDQPPAAKHARRQSATTKKATSRKPSVAQDGSLKPKQSKSRNGCLTCKAKRLKCGEEKPGCQQCAKRKVECGGYKKDFKWRPFEETNVKANIDRQKRASPPRVTSQDAPRPGSSRNLAILPAATRDDNGPRKDSSLQGAAEESTQLRLPQRPADHQSHHHEQLSQRDATSLDREQEDRAPSPDDNPFPPLPRSSPATVPIGGISPHSLARGRTSSTGAANCASPTLTEILMPYNHEPPDSQGDYVPFQMPDDFSLPFAEFPVIDPVLDNPGMADEDIEEIIRNSRSASDAQQISPYNTPTSSNSSGSDDLHHSWSGPVDYLYTQPFLAADSVEMLTFRFDKLTCGILSVMDGPNENPWRSLIWPLAQESPALRHAIIAMAAYHSSTDLPQLRVAGHEHKQKSIRYIGAGIRDGTMDDQTAIATALALGFSESWDQHTATGNAHIKGAQCLVKRALTEHQCNPLTGVNLSRLKFLCNAWVYMDVIARLTSVDSDESNDFDNTFMFSADSPQIVMGGKGLPGFGIDFGMPIDARLDPLMGCANTLFPLIGRVANLVRKVCRSMTTSPAVISQANDLKLALETWEPPSFIEPPEDPTSQVQHAIQTAEAYRWATLLHLHRSVPDLPSMSSYDLAQKVLSYLATVPLASRTVIVQIYPLMVAGCEAIVSEDRDWVRERWGFMAERMRIGVVDKSAIVTEEVWRRKDAYEAQPRSSRKLIATSYLQPVRQRGQPLKRTRSGFEDADPGRKGIGYSWVEGEGGEAGRAENDDKRFPPRHAAPANIGKMDPAYTVRGHLHWVGVMWDWGWEVLLG